MGGGVCFGEEHQEGSVDSTKINSPFIEGVKKLIDIRSHHVPEGGKEGGPKTIRA
jgi:hypothetical protein